MEPRLTATLKDQVYQIIKQEILNGNYEPGQWLQENEVASSLNVSRSPVREALRALANDGLVVEMPNKGVFVREFDANDIKDIFDFRIIIETYAIQRSKDHMTPEAAAELRETVNALKRAHKLDDLKQYVEIDTQLHYQIMELSGNALVLSTFERLRSMLQPFRIYSLLEPQRFRESLDEHADTVEYMLVGDIDKAVRVNTEHLALAQSAVMAHINKNKKDKEAQGDG